MKTQFKTHGLSKHNLYSIYNNIIARCYDTKAVNYGRYGGVGVTVCDEWKDDFVSFYNWCMANGWKPGLQIDKDIIGNSLIYSPNMCCIVTREENNQAFKKSSNILEYKGVRKTIAKWAVDLNVKASTLYARSSAGWDSIRIFETPFISNSQNQIPEIKYAFGFIN
jgi:hypothetical protein